MRIGLVFTHEQCRMLLLALSLASSEQAFAGETFNLDEIEKVRELLEQGLSS